MTVDLELELGLVSSELIIRINKYVLTHWAAVAETISADNKILLLTKAKNLTNIQLGSHQRKLPTHTHTSPKCPRTNPEGMKVFQALGNMR